MPLQSVECRVQSLDSHEILRWYGREAHPDFDVCADDHCQRYQGITRHSHQPPPKRFAQRPVSSSATTAAICDARFSKCCGGITERYATAWEDADIPYLESIYDVRHSPALTLLRPGYVPHRRLTATRQIRNSYRAFSRDSIRRRGILPLAGRVHTRRTRRSDQIQG